MNIKLFDHVSLRPLQATDAKDIYDTIDAQRVYLGRWLPFVVRTNDVEFTQNAVNSMLSSDEMTFTIRKGELFIGLIGFKATDKGNLKTEIGYWLSKEVQRNGIMTRSVESLCHYAFDEQGNPFPILKMRLQY